MSRGIVWIVMRGPCHDFSSTSEVSGKIEEKVVGGGVELRCTGLLAPPQYGEPEPGSWSH